MPRIIPWNSVSIVLRSRSDSDEQPKASTTHSIPLMPASPLRLRLPAFRAELARARDGLSALAAEFRGRGCCTCGCWRRATSAGGRRSRLLHRVHHRLAHGDSRAQPGAHPDCSATFVGGGNRNSLRHLVLSELSHVAEHVHANALVEHFLKLIWKRKVLHHEAIETQAVLGKCRFEVLIDFVR